MHPPDSIIVLTNVGGAALWVHILLGLWVSFKIRRNSEVASEMFASPSFGGLLPWPHLMRIKYYLPWVPAPKTASLPKAMRRAAWATRVSGSVFIVCLFGIFGVFGSMVVFDA